MNEAEEITELQKPQKFISMLVKAFVLIVLILLLLNFLLSMVFFSSCIIAGTSIDTPSGSRAIESLVIGDEVLSRAPNGEIQPARVTATAEHSVSRYLHFVFEDGSELGATAEHPFATPAGWTNAGDLKIGDSVLAREGLRNVRSIDTLFQNVKVYDLTVEPNSNFFAAGMLVHNKRIRRRERYMIEMINRALEQYKSDFRTYPPDTEPGKDGSAILTHYLCRQIKGGELIYGPYLENTGNAELVSSLGGRYVYKLIDGDEKSGPRALVIDPGKDKLLGGTVDSKRGFVKDIWNASNDNLYNIDLLELHRP